MSQRKQRVKEWWLLVGVWYLATIFLLLIRLDETDLNPVNESIESVRVVPVWLRLVLAAPYAILVGTLYTALNRLWERKAFRRMSYGKLMLIKSFAILIVLYFSFVVISRFALRAIGELDYFSEVLFSRVMIQTISYMFVVTLLISFVQQISTKFGPGNLFKMLTGKFYHPKEEERIFMFLDLRSSTTIAEELGHITYSRLIQDCFSDITIVKNYQAEVYQYVGDEAVLSWSVDNGIREGNCIEAFYAFHNELLSHSERYKERYGFVPEFKAGVNVGKVVVTEVGDIKREIAYHGDTLNTTARIEGKCNELDATLLISESLRSRLTSDLTYNIDLIGNVELRGKKETINIYKVERDDKHGGNRSGSEVEV